ncbi:hypothetical protein MKK53_05200 [Methylobacterium sp. J-076]|nr:hypothetical protein [Methylobacterium sp. J-076]
MAFAIVAGATVVVQRNLVQSRAAAARAMDRGAPEWLARTLLAEPLSDLDMSMGGRSGIECGHWFEVRLTPLADDQLGQKSDRGANPLPDRAGRRVRWQPMRVSIAVETGPATWLTFQTVKLGRVVVGVPAGGG